ncbi:MAG: hypothetical protein ACWGOX_05655, partial [Desulforhopalus sp.]
LESAPCFGNRHRAPVVYVWLESSVVNIVPVDDATGAENELTEEVGAKVEWKAVIVEKVSANFLSPSVRNCQFRLDRSLGREYIDICT